MLIRRATVADVPSMHKLINDAAEYGLMLPKALAVLYENVREFVVAADEPSAEPASAGGRFPGPDARPQPPGPILGCCGLSIIWGDLAEIVSLAVAPGSRGRGIGRRLTQACLDEARALGIARVMALTYERPFFERLGFEVVDRLKLPHKVWAECVRCPKHDACDEIAMMKVLEGVPAAAAPTPPVSSRYDVPVQLTASRSRG